MKRISIGLAVALALPLGCSKSEDKAPAPANKITSEKAPETARPMQQETLPTLDAIVDAHLTALGGADKWRAAKTMSYTFASLDGDTKMVSTQYRKRPNLLRVEGQKGDESFVKIFDGTAGYYAHGDEKKRIEGEKAKGMAMHAQFDDVMLTYKEDGTKINVLGKRDVDGHLAYALEIGHQDNTTEVRYIDAKSYLEVKREMSWEHEGKRESKTYYFTDYKPVDGLVINHGFATESADGKLERMEVKDIKVDAPMNDEMFRIPGES